MKLINKKNKLIILLIFLVISFFNVSNNLKADTTDTAGFNFKITNLLGGKYSDEFINIFNYDGGYLLIGSITNGGNTPVTLPGSSNNLVAIKCDEDLNFLGYKTLNPDIGTIGISILDKNGNLLVDNWVKGERLIDKYDKNGNLLFSYNLGGTTWWANQILELKDGSYLFVEYSNASFSDAKIEKVSNDGNKIWKYQIGYKEGVDNQYFDAKELADGSIIVAGSTRGGAEIISHPNNDLKSLVPVVFKLDKDGNRVWDYVVETNNGNESYTYNHVEIKNDKIYLFVQRDKKTSCEIYEFDKNGNFLSMKNIGNTGVVNDILQTGDGGFLLTGYSSTDNKSILGKYDNKGNLEWQNIKLGKDKVELNDTIITPDGYYITVGSAQPKGLSIPTTGYGSDDALVLKNDYLPNLKSDNEKTIHVKNNKSDDDLLKLFNISAIDKEEGSLTSLINVDQSKVDYNTPGEYDVVVSVKDNSNIIDNTGKKELNEVIKTVKLKIINDKPIINVDSEKYSSKGKVISNDELKTLFNVKANDYEDGDLTSKVVVDSSAVDFNKIGDYNITFTVSDSLGETTSVTVVLHITNEKPIISADDIHQGHINEVISDDDLLKLFNVSATDLEDGDITSKVVVDSSAVDFNTEGTYEIVLTVTDSDGNKVEKKVSIEIVADMDPELNSDDSKEVEEGNPLSDDEIKQLFNVMAKDYEDGDLTRDVVVDQSKVDYNTPGEYEINFYVIDSYGNKVEKIVILKIIKSSKPISPEKPKDDNKVDSKDKTSNDKLIQTGMTLNINLIIISLLSIKVIRRTSRV